MVSDVRLSHQGFKDWWKEKDEHDTVAEFIQGCDSVQSCIMSTYILEEMYGGDPPAKEWWTSYDGIELKAEDGFTFAGPRWMEDKDQIQKIIQAFDQGDWDLGPVTKAEFRRYLVGSVGKDKAVELLGEQDDD